MSKKIYANLFCLQGASYALHRILAVITQWLMGTIPGTIAMQMIVTGRQISLKMLPGE